MTSDEPALTTITVDGRLSGESIDTLETFCNRAASKRKPVRLLLRDVSAIGHDGLALLRRLASKDVGLKASGIYTSYLVELIQQKRLPHSGLRR
ncbi:MAG: hypothetical protein LAQ69_03515 [Acidobacteriia bacterium]|nr:hypothetical protein [Terriglobia bacterium]